jgi:hypothetical protein
VLRRRHEHGFVAGAADLEEGLALVLELDLLVVDGARQEHQTIGGEKLVPGKTFVLSIPLPGSGTGRGACSGSARLAGPGEGRALHGGPNYVTIEAT